MKQKKLMNVIPFAGKSLFLGGLLALGAAVGLSACGGGADNPQNPNVVTTPGYHAGKAANQDVINFRNDLWANIHDTAHCGSCHDYNGPGGLDFANNSNINAAYKAANIVVNKDDPASSLMVTKFSTGSGHVCWLGTTSTDEKNCANALTAWITKWAQDSANTSGATAGTIINLIPPTGSVQPAPVTVLPAQVPQSYYTTDSAHSYNIYDLVSHNCNGCHVPHPTKIATPPSPLFAITAAMDNNNLQQAEKDSYAAVISVPLVNTGVPTLSRLYARLAVDGHNCFQGLTCAQSAAQMLDAINNFTAGLPTNGTSSLSGKVTSDAVNLLHDGIVASGGGRYENYQIAEYKFLAGAGDQVLDLSGVYPSANLTLKGIPGTDYQWLPNWGVEFLDNGGGRALVSEADGAKKLRTLIAATGQYSIEAWLVPAKTNLADANIVAYTGGDSLNDFALKQNDDMYDVYGYSTNPSANSDGNPVLETANANLKATLQHVVVTYDQTHGRQVYVDGKLDTQDSDPIGPGSLANWNDSSRTGFDLVLGNNLAGSKTPHPWQGAIRMLAIHNHALSAAQVSQNFKAGVGQSYYLMFNISDIPNHPLLPSTCKSSDGAKSYCYIVMKASIFDKSSYIFSNPRFVDINDTNANFTGTLLIKGMRIGINGEEAQGGQAYEDIDVCVNGTDGGCGDANSIGAPYNNNKGQDEGALLSSVGTVIEMQHGPSTTKDSKGNTIPGDEIFVSFETLGNNVVPQGTYDVAFPTSPTPPAVNPPAAGSGNDIMIHSFEEINATLSALTGVSMNTPDINNSTDGTYTTVIQGLPSSHDASSYVAANQTSLVQLAVGYCQDLVAGKGTIPPSTYFGLNLSGNVDLTSAANRSAIIDGLLARVMNVDYSTTTPTELSIMPPESTVHGILDKLIYDGSTTTPTGLAVDNCANPSACTPTEMQPVLAMTCMAAVSGAPTLLK